MRINTVQRKYSVPIVDTGTPANIHYQRIENVPWPVVKNCIVVGNMFLQNGCLSSVLSPGSSMQVKLFSYKLYISHDILMFFLLN